jgi:hypothetical protein
MKSAEQCREALQKLASRLSELSPADRDAYFGNQTLRFGRSGLASRPPTSG